MNDTVEERQQVRVVILTDSRTIDTVLRGVMTADGDRFAVETIHSSEDDFFDKIVAGTPHLVFLRTELSHARGTKVCERIKETDSLHDTRVIFLSGDPRIRQIAINHRADRFLSLPFTPDDVQQVLEDFFAPAKRILYVDDSDLFHKILVGPLEEEGYHVIQAWDGQEALEIVDSENLDLVLSDIEMPGMDGLSLCKSIKNSEIGDLPVALLTSHTSEEVIQKGFESGADDFIAKPIIVPEVLSRVKRLLGGVLERRRFERILLAEDSEPVRTMISTALRAQGFHVDEAENGAKAFAMAMGNIYDLLITDYEMPHLNGVELALRLREKGKDRSSLPVMFVTGHNTKTDLVKIRSIGIESFLAKPFSADRIVAEVERVLVESRLENRAGALRGYGLGENAIRRFISCDTDDDVGDEQFRSVLFVDIAGFFKHTQSLNPKEVVKVLNDFQNCVREIIMKHVGTVDQFNSDTVSASFFGQREGALHAAQAAMEITQEEFPLFRNKTRQQLQVRIGIHSGYVVLGSMAGDRGNLGQIAVLGKNVILAQALENHAEIGGILISDATYRMIREHVTIESSVTVSLKESDEPITAHHLVGIEQQ
ncbi:MAG: response regulator [Magnetococcales bacterium]|nr:response regulator [Magnetococcales bacterium]